MSKMQSVNKNFSKILSRLENLQSQSQFCVLLNEDIVKIKLDSGHAGSETLPICHRSNPSDQDRGYYFVSTQ